MHEEYRTLAKELKEYSYERKGTIARLMYRAAEAIEDLLDRLKVLETDSDDLK